MPKKIYFLCKSQVKVNKQCSALGRYRALNIYNIHKVSIDGLIVLLEYLDGFEKFYIVFFCQ